ncbi:MAG: cytochrome c maturation protein CcmE [Bacteroidota bacterium]
MKPFHIVIIVALAIFIAVVSIDLSTSASIYTDFATAKVAEKKVHIVGKWVQRDMVEETPYQFSFYLQDTLQEVELVHYYKGKPSNFEQAEKIVVVGGYEEEGFVADNIVMKCPSKYEPTDITAQQ